MAATVDSARYKLSVPFVMYEIQLSSLVADQPETLTHVHTGCTPFKMDFAVVTAPTDGSLVGMRYLESDFNTTNNTVIARFTCPVGGSLDGAKVKVWIWFVDVASGGMTPT
jgi:hypothetical protein